MKQRGAIVAGVIGADLPARVVLILGVVNVLANGFSMAAVNFQRRTEIEEYQHKRSVEERHVDLYPDGERDKPTAQQRSSLSPTGCSAAIRAARRWSGSWQAAEGQRAMASPTAEAVHEPRQACGAQDAV